MTFSRLLTASLLVCLSGMASAQSTESVMDLPILPPVFEKNKSKAGWNPQDIPVAPSPIPPPSAPPEPDPRDVPPPVFYGEEIETANSSIVYVVDRSGSMGEGRRSMVWQDPRRPTSEVIKGNKWQRAFMELSKSIRGLADSFKFTVLAYDHTLTPWRIDLQVATTANKTDAILWALCHRYNGGATATAPAVCWSFGVGADAIVLLTDGSPNVGAMPQTPDAHRRMIRQNNHNRTPISVFGISATGEFRLFCQNVASDSGGGYFEVP